MAEIPSMSVSPIRGDSQSFPITYVIIGAVALIPVMLVPAVFMFAGRYHTRHPPSPLGGAPRDILLEEAPKLFEVHVKPGLEAGEARFEDILPMAVCIVDANAGEKQPPEATAEDQDVPKAYDIAVLIAMPTSHPCVTNHWGELGEYVIGTLEFAATISLDDPTHRVPLRSVSIPWP